MIVLKMTDKVFRLLQDTVGTQSPETGAILGWNGQIVLKVWYDEVAGQGKPYYRPSKEAVEAVVNDWIRSGNHFAGIVHSHANGYPSLSPMDIRSAVLIMEANQMESILMGLFCGNELRMYKITRNRPGERPEIEQVEIQIV